MVFSVTQDYKWGLSSQIASIYIIFATRNRKRGKREFESNLFFYREFTDEYLQYTLWPLFPPRYANSNTFIGPTVKPTFYLIAMLRLRILDMKGM